MSSRQTHLLAALASILVTTGSPVRAQSEASSIAEPTRASDAELLAAAKGALRGSPLATARAALPGGEIAFLAAVRGPGAKVGFAMTVIGRGEAGGLALLGRDEVDGSPAAGPPTVALSLGSYAPGAITATVGWKAPDGRAEERLLLYRYGDRKLSPLLALPPALQYPRGSGRPSELRAVEVLPTGTAGYRDLRVRSRILDCAAEGVCAEAAEVVSYVFDGVRYAPRPHAIPFVETIVASSTLAERGGLANRSASAAIDGRIDTAWCEGAKGAGWFEKLELTFVPAQRVRAVSIVPGLGAGAEFRERTRPKRIRVLLPDGRKAEGDLADEPKAQRLELPEGERVFGMTVVIVDVHKGTREDACIGELDVEVEP